MFLPHPRVKVSIVESLRDREVACSASDRQGSNFKSCVWRTVSSQSSHHPQEVLLAQFSLYVHKGGLKPDSFHFFIDGKRSEHSSHDISAPTAFTCFTLGQILYVVIIWWQVYFSTILYFNSGLRIWLEIVSKRGQVSPPLCEAEVDLCGEQLPYSDRCIARMHRSTSSQCYIGGPIACLYMYTRYCY